MNTAYLSPIYVQLLSACCPLVVRLLSVFKLNNNRKRT